jgi:hypothetical protein
MMAYRSAIQETTGYSPNQMMLGRETELPIDILIGAPPEEPTAKSGIEYVDNMKERMELVYDKARSNGQRRSDRQKRNYDLKAQVKKYERGDAVWLHNPARKKGVSPKLTRAWEGPYLVVHRLSDVTYRGQRGPRAKMKVVHFDRLKPYQGDNKPDWHVKIDAGIPEPMDIPAQEGNQHADDLNDTVIYVHDGVPEVTGPIPDMEINIPEGGRVSCMMSQQGILMTYYMNTWRVQRRPSMTMC